MIFFRPLIKVLPAITLVFCVSLPFMLLVSPANAQDALTGLTGGLPALTSQEFGDGTTSYSLSLQILALMTALTLLPSLILGMTSFVLEILLNM